MGLKKRNETENEKRREGGKKKYILRRTRSEITNEDYKTMRARFVSKAVSVFERLKLLEILFTLILERLISVLSHDLYEYKNFFGVGI